MLAHKQISFPQATTTTEVSSMISTAQRSTSNQPTNHDDKGWQHPGEFGRVTAWLDRSKRDLRMARNIDGNAPSAIFKPREDMFISVPAMPTPAGMDEPDANTGEAYIRKSDGTPKLKGSMNFVNIPLTLVGE